MPVPQGAVSGPDASLMPWPEVRCRSPTLPAMAWRPHDDEAPQPAHILDRLRNDMRSRVYLQGVWDAIMALCIPARRYLPPARPC